MIAVTAQSNPGLSSNMVNCYPIYASTTVGYALAGQSCTLPALVTSSLPGKHGDMAMQVKLCVPCFLCSSKRGMLIRSSGLIYPTYMVATDGCSLSKISCGRCSLPQPQILYVSHLSNTMICLLPCACTRRQMPNEPVQPFARPSIGRSNQNGCTSTRRVFRLLVPTQNERQWPWFEAAS